MKTAQAFWRIGTRLLALFTVATALLLILFSGLKGYAASLQELPSTESAANLPLRPMHISSSATISSCELDIVLILDRSASMQEDTICFGCYEPGDSIYPSGTRYPLNRLWDLMDEGLEEKLANIPCDRV